MKLVEKIPSTSFHEGPTNAVHALRGRQHTRRDVGACTMLVTPDRGGMSWWWDVGATSAGHRGYVEASMDDGDNAKAGAEAVDTYCGSLTSHTVEK